MFFHYGNCKSEIQELKLRNLDLMNQVQELKALFDYQVGTLEIEISQLLEEAGLRASEIRSRGELIAQLKQELGARKCVADSCEEEIKALKVANKSLVEENKRLEKKIAKPKKKGKDISYLIDGTY